ncbi:MAG: prepilin-type N-terminal cleavage/methylation domain-containing protein [Candidatus Omnitrophota bacterium]|jgi:prepilin-type N-terminal cleavage/methylation domain-containing protein
MDRLKRSNKGFTLLELIIAIALFSVVLFSVFNLLINFGKFSTNVVKAEASLMGTSLGVFEEMVGKLTAANEVTIPAPSIAAPSIAIRVDELSISTPSSTADDTIYTYWQDGTQLKYKSKVGAAAESGVSILANDIFSLSFTQDATYKNQIKVILEARSASGPVSSTSNEKLETTVVLRSRSANKA